MRMAKVTGCLDSLRLRRHGIARHMRVFSHTTAAERLALFALARSLPPRARALEIGSHIGSSALFLCAGLSQRGGHLICVDNWLNENMPDGAKDTYPEFAENTRSYAGMITPVRKFSNTLTEGDIGGMLDLAFIDGDHVEQAVREDFILMAPWVKPGGFIAFHDASSQLPRRQCRAWRSAGRSAVGTGETGRQPGRHPTYRPCRMTGYVFTADVHSAAGALAGARRILGEELPQSLLDVGCGWGTWLRAAKALGIADVNGIDAQALPEYDDLDGAVMVRDLSQPFDLGRRFDVVLCLEVAEHLDDAHAASLIASLCRHGDRIIFSAACPNQFGQNHVNCQWPAYWQTRFNAAGFACSDSIRWDIWDDPEIEPWYRQNLFVAEKSPSTAGSEPRLRAAIHPDMLPFLGILDRIEVETGRLSMRWYLRNLLAAIGGRSLRLFASQRATGR